MKNKEFLITLEEALFLAEKETVVTDAVFAKKIFDAYIEQCKHNPLLVEAFADAAVFNAGRVQGIREERKK